MQREQPGKLASLCSPKVISPRQAHEHPHSQAPGPGGRRQPAALPCTCLPGPAPLGLRCGRQGLVCTEVTLRRQLATYGPTWWSHPGGGGGGYLDGLGTWPPGSVRPQLTSEGQAEPFSLQHAEARAAGGVGGVVSPLVGVGVSSMTESFNAKQPAGQGAGGRDQTP